MNVGGGGGRGGGRWGGWREGTHFSKWECHPNFQILNMGFGELGLICFPPVRFGV